MRLYKFSPIKSEEELLLAVKHIHFECYKLCKETFGKYLQNAGNMGVFCHYEDEFKILKRIRENITESSDNPDQKYFRLNNPIVISAKGDMPETTYTHLYIRKPDPYRNQVGDIDFYLDPENYQKLKQSLLDGNGLKGARVFERADLDMVELHNPDVDVLAYVSTKMMTKKGGIKSPEAKPY